MNRLSLDKFWRDDKTECFFPKLKFPFQMIPPGDFRSGIKQAEKESLTIILNQSSSHQQGQQEMGASASHEFSGV